MDDFPAARFRERSPSDPLITLSSYLTDHRKVRFRSSSVESNDDIEDNWPRRAMEHTWYLHTRQMIHF
jgi:hypothetical protein